MKKIVLVVLVSLLIVGCTPNSKKSIDNDTEEVIFNVISPKGAPALSILNYASSHEDSVDFVDGADLLQAAFLNPTPEYDVIIAPTNLGVKLASMGKTEYKLASVVTWGNLYFVGKSEDALTDPGVLAAFGESSVPGLLLESLKEGITPEIVYYNSVVDVQAALISGKADVALLADPAATATIKKWESMDRGYLLGIIGDVQELVEPQLGSYGYPQAGVFVRESLYAENPDKVEKFLDRIKNDLGNMTSDDITGYIETLSAETLGVPNSEIVLQTWARMNIKYVDVTEVYRDLENFLKLFQIEVSEDAYLK